jgi:histidinol dehydrogenase
VKTLRRSNLSEAERATALARPQQRVDAALRSSVAGIVEDVRSGGWGALCSIARRIDGAEPLLVEVGPAAAEAKRLLSAEQVAAIELAARNIRTFHEASLPGDIYVETAPGLTVGKVWRAIDRVGIYVPGGKTPLFSTLLMLAIPAQVAGVGELIAVTPPGADGSLDPFIALAAQLCGIQALWTVGGAQGIAALAFGAGDIAKVDKVCGPGNAWVAEAKRLVASLPGGPAIDMPAGPSELLVIADDSADAGVVASDLLSQAEHDANAQVILITPSQRLAEDVSRAIDAQVADLPRSDIACEALASARLVLAKDLEEAVAIANLYAPEHLSLAVEGASALIPAVRNAGAVFAGPLAAETFGDYIAGSSHVLPTDGAARAWGGVSAYTFLRAMSVQTVTPEGARRIAAPAAALARMEQLEAHARAAEARLELVR